MTNMNTKLKIIFCFFVFTLEIFSQDFNGIIEYGKKSEIQYPSKKYKDLKEENFSKFQEFQKMDRLISYSEKKMTFELKIANKSSFFEAKTILETKNNNILKIGMGLYGSGKYYNNFSEQLMQLNVYGELFLIKKPKLKWIITKEIKKIGNYNCYKATTEIIINSKGKKRIITAWFTSEIPVSFGPLGYAGLPGLILELEVYKKIYYAKKITINPKEEIKIEKLTKGIRVTEKEFHEMVSSTMQKFKKNKGF